MLRSFLKDSLVYGLSTVVARGVALLAVPILTRFLTPADYGAIDVIAVFTSFAGVLVSLEIVQAVARFYPDSHDPDERVRIASSSLLFAAGAYGLLLLVGQVAAPQLARLLLADEGLEPLVRIALVAIAANGIFYVVQSQLRWRLMAARYAVASVLYALVSVGAGVALIVAGMGVAGIFVGQVLGAISGGVVSIRSLRGDFAWRLDRRLLRDMLRFSTPLVPSSLSVYLTLYVDRITINVVLGLGAVGLFGVGYRVASLVTLVNVGIQGALTPLIYTHFRHERTPGDIARIFRIYVAVLLLAWLGLGLFSREILAIVTTPAYAEAAVVVPLIAPALVFTGLYVFAPGLNIQKRTSRIAVVNAGGAIMNTLLNIALVPVLGIVGAATATLASSVVVFAVNMALSQREYPVPHDWRTLVVATLGVAIVILLGWVLEPGFVAKAGLFVAGAAIPLVTGLVASADVRGGWQIFATALRRLRAANDV